MKKKLEANKASIAILEQETSKRLVEVRRERRNGAWFTKPNIADLYVWQLKVTRLDVSYGYRGTHTWTELFLTRDLTFEGAAETVMASYENHELHDKHMLELYKDKKYEEFAGYVSQHYSKWDFEVRCVPVKAHAKYRQISDYQEGEEDE